MIPYVITYIMSLLSLITINRDKNNILLYILICFIVLLSGFRYGIGIDYFAYIDFINQVIYNNHPITEFGFQKLVLLLNNLGFNYQGIFLIYATLTIFGSARFYIKYSKMPALSLFLFITFPILFLSSMNIIRQFLSVMIFMYAIKFLITKSFTKFAITMLLATLFHKTALLMFPIYFIANNKNSMLNFFIIIVLYIILLQFIEIIANYVGFSAMYFQAIKIQEAIPMKSYVNLFIFIFIFIQRKQLIKLDKNNKIFINLYFLSVLISFTPLFTELPVAPFLRLNIYFLIALPILLTNIVNIIQDKNLKFIYLITLIIVASLYYFSTLLINGELYKLTPYDLNLNIRQ